MLGHGKECGLAWKVSLLKICEICHMMCAVHCGIDVNLQISVDENASVGS